MIQRLKRLFKDLVPPSRPTMDEDALRKIAVDAMVDSELEVCLIGIRGFYNNGQNQRGIYDDAIFLVTPRSVKGFNANTDPSKFRKAIANLVPGKWTYRIGIHGLSRPKILQYKALVQASEVVVLRDNVGLDKGFFGINIHRGEWLGTSSEGCQTIYKPQWDEFFQEVEKALKLYNQKTIPYILREMIDEIY